MTCVVAERYRERYQWDLADAQFMAGCEGKTIHVFEIAQRLCPVHAGICIVLPLQFVRHYLGRETLSP